MMHMFQDSIPTFVRKGQGLKYKGRQYKKNDLFPWKELGVSFETARILFGTDQIYHNPELEAQAKVGDRLEEFSDEDLNTVVKLMNAEVKERTSSKKEFDQKRMKISKIRNKQVALIRQWLRGNEWAIDLFYEKRDYILSEGEYKKD